MRGEISSKRSRKGRRNINRTDHMSFGVFSRVPDIQEESVRHFSPQDIAGDHSRKVYWIFCRPILWSIAKLRLLEIVNSPLFLNSHAYDVDAFVYALLADRLHAENSSVRFSEQEFQVYPFGSGVIERVMVRMKIDFFELFRNPKSLPVLVTFRWHRCLPRRVQKRCKSLFLRPAHPCSPACQPVRAGQRNA